MIIDLNALNLIEEGTERRDDESAITHDTWRSKNSYGLNVHNEIITDNTNNTSLLVIKNAFEQSLMKVKNRSNMISQEQNIIRQSINLSDANLSINSVDSALLNSDISVTDEKVR
jgi:hypothetical protein